MHPREPWNPAHRSPHELGNLAEEEQWQYYCPSRCQNVKLLGAGQNQAMTPALHPTHPRSRQGHVVFPLYAWTGARPCSFPLCSWLRAGPNSLLCPAMGLGHAPTPNWPGWGWATPPSSCGAGPCPFTLHSWFGAEPHPLPHGAGTGLGHVAPAGPGWGQAKPPSPMCLDQGWAAPLCVARWGMHWVPDWVHQLNLACGGIGHCPPGP